jgi:hypothetical protein
MKNLPHNMNQLDSLRGLENVEDYLSNSRRSAGITVNTCRTQCCILMEHFLPLSRFMVLAFTFWSAIHPAVFLYGVR